MFLQRIWRMTMKNGVTAIRRCGTSREYYQPFWAGYLWGVNCSSLIALLACIYIAFSINLFADALFSLYDLCHDPITKRRPPCCGVDAESTQVRNDRLAIWSIICYEKRNIDANPGSGAIWGLSDTRDILEDNLRWRRISVTPYEKPFSFHDDIIFEPRLIGSDITSLLRCDPSRRVLQKLPSHDADYIPMHEADAATPWTPCFSINDPESRTSIRGPRSSNKVRQRNLCKSCLDKAHEKRWTPPFKCTHDKRAPRTIRMLLSLPCAHCPPLSALLCSILRDVYSWKKRKKK